MADRVVPGPVESSASIREAVCINTRKIFDSCKDKDCVDDLRVYPIACCQSYIENALSIRPKSAELLHVAVKVEPVSFNRGCYTVDCTYFYRVTGETFPACHICTGLAVFDKRVMLFGSEGSVKSFSSLGPMHHCGGNDMPIAVVNSVDPIALHMRISDAECLKNTEMEQRSIPECISACFSDSLLFTDTARRWFVTIGQFSIIRLERDTQLLIPAYDYCLPDKECPGGSDDDPCTLFSRIRFPVDEFFPPDDFCGCEDYKSMV
ncbi:MAG: hypothetical protein HP001_03030 [Oscillospiraceae bacterium]|nr:hypothetical protein [Oscillospiraceae bacterium]